MRYTYQFNDKLTLSGEVQKLQHIVRLMSFLEELPDHCPICEAEVHFFYRNPKDYDYYGLRCKGTPAHETNFGQKKKTGELFYKGKWEEEYQGDGNGSKPTRQEEPPVPEDEMDDLPF